MARRVIWLKNVAVIAALVVAACSSEKGSRSGEDEGDSPEDQGPVPGQNYPQVELAKRSGAIRISGKIEIPGYERGTIQVDVYLPTRHIEGKTPVTTKQFQEPGPYDLLLPAGSEKVQLYAILDFDSDGPSAIDAAAEYAENPLDVREKTTGINFLIDKSNTKLPPPDKNGGDNRPPWETSEEKAVGPTGGNQTGDGSGAEGTGPTNSHKHMEAPPGAPGGADVKSGAPSSEDSAPETR